MKLTDSRREPAVSAVKMSEKPMSVERTRRAAVRVQRLVRPSHGLNRLCEWRASGALEGRQIIAQGKAAGAAALGQRAPTVMSLVSVLPRLFAARQNRNKGQD